MSSASRSTFSTSVTITESTRICAWFDEFRAGGIGEWAFLSRCREVAGLRGVAFANGLIASA